MSFFIISRHAKKARNMAAAVKSEMETKAVEAIPGLSPPILPILIPDMMVKTDQGKYIQYS